MNSSVAHTRLNTIGTVALLRAARLRALQFLMRSRTNGQTIFELLWLVLILISFVTGIYLGSHWGLAGAVIGGIVGSIAGYFLGKTCI